MDYSDKPLLDRDILKENTMDSAPLQAELFTLFFDQGTLYLSQLEDALRAEDRAAWQMTAHGIKGASRSLGFIRLATAAMEAEKSTPDAANLEQIRAVMQDTRGTVWPRENAA